MLFCQLDYNEELGTGTGFSIAHYGCALTSLASMLVNVFDKQTDPLTLNNSLISVHGFADNGQHDFDIVKWGSITDIYPSVKFVGSYVYPTEPADMTFIDNELAKGFSVIVGVSFNHVASEQTPSHYVEIYRKNSDGTYQCRDPWYRDSECDTVFDHRYAVNGMSVAQCILQVVVYEGELPNVVIPKTHYTVGDTISIDTDVPVGKAPGLETFNYGKVGANAPAKISGIVLYNGLAYYDIDQTAIGGGTGYVKAQDVDSHIIITTPVQPSVARILTQPESTTPQVQQVVTDTASQEALSMQEQRDKALIDFKDLQEKYDTDLANYQGIVAAGYTTADDIHKAFELVKTENLGLQKSAADANKKAEDLALILANESKKDYTAIDKGLQTERDLVQLQTDMEQIAKAHKAKPTLFSILNAVADLKIAYEKVCEQLKRKTPQEDVQIVKTDIENPQIQETSISWFEKLFGLKSQGKGV